VKTTDIRADVVIGDNEQGIKTVAGNPTPSVMCRLALVNTLPPTIPIKLLPVEGVAASIANVSNGTFPISPPNLVTNKQPTGLTKDFIDFALSGCARHCSGSNILSLTNEVIIVWILREWL